MNHQIIINRLAENKLVFAALLQNIPEELIKWTSGEKNWSLLEIINHLHDEEQEDFRRRLDLTLGDPTVEWPPIDPAKWVTEKNYMDRDFSESVNAFLAERDKSIEWLNNLESPDWKSTFQHKLLGPMSAENILANWLAHDLLHIRQITTVHWEFLSGLSESNLNYAGNWQE
jgi:hypothetical protein